MSQSSLLRASGSPKVHCEISIIPIGMGRIGMSKEIAAAVSAVRKVKGVKLLLTPMGSQIEANSIDDVLEAIKYAHVAVRSKGATRIISSIRIDQRFDKEQTLDDKVRSVKKILKK